MTIKRRRNSSPQSSRALTLLEVMVVTVLMAMVGSVIVVSLGASDQAARSIATIGQLKDLDLRGRLFAQTSGSATELQFANHRVVLVIRAGSPSSAGEVISKFDLGDITLQIETNESVQRIQFDRLGRSPDYTVTIQRTSGGDSGGASGVGGWGGRRWEVFGITGQFVELEEPKR